MTEITIRAFAGLREIFGAEHSVTVPEKTSVLGAVAQFADASSHSDELFDAGKLKSHIILMYNRERIDADDAMEIQVNEGDEIVLYPPVSGG